MSTIQYQHSLHGKGVGAGLPLRRASKLYHVEPNIVYPNAFSTGTHSDLHTYSRGIFLRVPHLPITRVIEPYIANHKGPGGNAVFTRRQYFVIKRGQPLMAAGRRDPAIGIVLADGTVQTRTYIDPEKMAGNIRLVGYTDGTNTITVDAYNALPEDQKKNYREVYTGLEDTNDKIPTGGIDMRAEVEEALFGSTSIVKYVEVDADSFYFGAATKADGFIAPSTGGFDRTIFYNEVDQEAGVTLPTDGSGASPRIVTPIGNVTDVRYDNAANYKDSVAILKAGPTIGFAHTDLEQATSHRFHMFVTGIEVHSPVRKGILTIPFVDIEKLLAIIAERAPSVNFNFTDRSNNKSGLKVGVWVDPSASDAKKLSVQNRYSLLTAADAGYANLYYNFGAPFLVTRRLPRLGDEIVPDLFGNYVLKGSGYFLPTATVADTEAEFGASDAYISSGGTSGESYGLTQAELDANKDGAQAVSNAHVCGKVTNVFDAPEQSMIKYVINNQPQLRTATDWATEMYSRVRSADTAGLEPILADFGLMLLGGSAYEWSTNYLPVWDGRRQNIASILEDLVVAGAIGIVEIAADVL